MTTSEVGRVRKSKSLKQKLVECSKFLKQRDKQNRQLQTESTKN